MEKCTVIRTETRVSTRWGSVECRSSSRVQPLNVELACLTRKHAQCSTSRTVHPGCAAWWLWGTAASLLGLAPTTKIPESLLLAVLLSGVAASPAAKPREWQLHSKGPPWLDASSLTGPAALDHREPHYLAMHNVAGTISGHVRSCVEPASSSVGRTFNYLQAASTRAKYST